MPSQALAICRPIGERVNFRILAIVGIFALLVGIPVYSFVEAQLSHGIERDGDVLRVDLKSLGYFPFNDATGTLADVPKDFRQLDGKRVALEGYLVPSNVAGDRINTFQFVYNVQICCFGGPPQVQERIYATVPSSASVFYTSQFTRLTGILHVNVIRDGDADANKIIKLYTMDVERVEPL